MSGHTEPPLTQNQKSFRDARDYGLDDGSPLAQPGIEIYKQSRKGFSSGTGGGVSVGTGGSSVGGTIVAIVCGLGLLWLLFGDSTDPRPSRRGDQRADDPVSTAPTSSERFEPARSPDLPSRSNDADSQAPVIPSTSDVADAPTTSSPVPDEGEWGPATPSPIADGSEAPGHAPQLVRKVAPRYPTLARQMRLEGTVYLQATIADDGTVREVSVISGPGLLIDAAKEAVREWRYTPAVLPTLRGRQSGPIAVTFQLEPR